MVNCVEKQVNPSHWITT